MDTRKKIVSFEEVLSMSEKREIRWVTGHFDPLLAEHARRLHQLALPGHLLTVVVTNSSSPLLSLRARGELVAALASVDYVVLKDRALPADDPEDAQITSNFIAHVIMRNGGNLLKDGSRILVVRLGAMGDVIHTLPAVASLKHSIPYSRITWVIEAKWAALLEGNPYVERVIALDRSSFAGLRATWRELRAHSFDCAVDFQGLTKSALVAALAWPERVYGFEDSRETPASWFYSSTVLPGPTLHMVDRNLALAGAAGASSLLGSFSIPAGEPEGELPGGEFVLASPFAGWGSKQWPIEYYSILGERIRRDTGMTLVLNAPVPLKVENTWGHVSGLKGLIHATRRAAAVVGLDSGPLHLATALGKQGVAIYGPTDPARNGPYKSNLTLLRSSDAITSYRRSAQPDASMRSITPDAVFEALKPALAVNPKRR